MKSGHSPHPPSKRQDISGASTLYPVSAAVQHSKFSVWLTDWQLSVDFVEIDGEPLDLGVHLDTTMEVFLRCRRNIEFCITVVNLANTANSVSYKGTASLLQPAKLCTWLVCRPLGCSLVASTHL